MAIQQHPLPQDISSYRFRLIGDMTIKQFASLGISIVVAVIVYSLPLPFFFKYPLSFIFIVLGVGMAFVPVQGRSLDVWILAFIRSIYSPTQYVWKRSKDISEEMTLPTGPLVGTQAVSNARIELTTASPNAPIVSITPASAPQAPTPSISTEPPLVAPSTSPVSITPPPVSPVQTEQPLSVPSSHPISDSTLNPTATATTTSLSAPTTPQVAQLPIPFTPTTPNTLVGLTLTPEGKILDGVLVEIQHNGLTSRATKSNKLGQFMFARPLENGLYQILAEKEDYTFSPYSLDLTGEIIRPLKVQAI
ncbi:hypothetical protein A3K29_01035 [Candidatus Collierbacteria bacterium RIFOXYB2_FULL_46_14]|uniref:Minus agglutinin n=1 Tax=Candidatus Collierbacteria bacterium GW2011_GWA2_46_26 TaxID=1618381 RepID=A0A0G1PKP0_9BACT|nr:MAG: hypothetical protein UW29_C0003G0038 [Candidatus Collierbacteria bacterium GW2011_GWC2_44_13]KKU33296.1 MAG: hypothetical protein UX47_C0005G0098 [Candidatus Collierbacteria bacterium GW2011_GWA2_46_26]OGD72716.1 MAG: hypothetical protein A3K29_01035 [Candidatus Collierbacteria bacterium RIFOXYB2_FULL_46_14]OGD75758.1 MAG: hypothetical protein A3K43_01035 [Candidatus Collierbacteria bacterium RIFOXYA2_FULL_46_20]OGD77094.1 MAG: hypothetical protein A3K39_01035 [Candidatus Collierbacteri